MNVRIKMTIEELDVLAGLLKAEIETGEYEAVGGESDVQLTREQTADVLIAILEKLEDAVSGGATDEGFEDVGRNGWKIDGRGE